MRGTQPNEGQPAFAAARLPLAAALLGLLLVMVLAAAGLGTTQPASAATLRQVDVGQNHACMLDASGQVTCWGDDSAGQVSDWGRWRYQEQQFDQVSAGSFLTCGILTDGSVSCWGYPEQDGINRESDSRDYDVWLASSDAATYTGWVNTPPSTVLFRPGSLSVGNYHACAIKTNGELACWGKAGDARLVIPTGTGGAAITDWTMVEAGFAHACGIREGDPAVAGGSVVCFGRTSHGRADGPSGAGPFIDVTLALYNGCALASDGSVECWGGHSAYDTAIQGDPDTRPP